MAVIQRNYKIDEISVVLHGMEQLNILAAWLAILIGFAAGALAGLSFQKEDWLGGYSSWPRRMMRLGHISFFGLAFVNIAFAATVKAYGLRQGAPHLIEPASILFLVGLISMPAICYGSAVRKVLRHLFFIPVGSLMMGAVLMLLALFGSGLL